MRKDRKLAVRKKTAVLGKKTQEKIPAMILKRADPKKEMETGTTLKAKMAEKKTAEKKILERKILEMKIPAKREKALIREKIRESLKREKTLVKTAAKTVLGKINLKKINPKKIRMKTDPGMKVADSLVLKKQIVLKAARVQ